MQLRHFLECWSLTVDGDHWPKYVKARFYCQNSLLRLMEFNPNFTYMLLSATAEGSVYYKTI
jgi:hypothetical protein